MKTIALSFVVFLSLAMHFPAKALANAKAPAKFSLSKLQKTYKTAGSIEADFVQEVYQASLARTKTSTGTLKLSKPNFVRWETHEPDPSVMVSNGKKLWYYNPDALGKDHGQVLVRHPNTLEKQAIFRILTGNSSLESDFLVEKIEGSFGENPAEKLTEKPGDTPREKKPAKSGLITLRLKPKKGLGDLSQAILKVNAKYMISELILENTSGNTTKLTLQNQVLGAKLPPVLFDFTPPQGTEILRNNE